MEIINFEDLKKQKDDQIRLLQDQFKNTNEQKIFLFKELNKQKDLLDSFLLKNENLDKYY